VCGVLPFGLLSMSNGQNVPLDVVRHELNYRREKQWKIFAWIATILVTVIGGIVAGKEHWNFDTKRKILMTLAVIVITGYASKWIHENIEREERARQKIVAYLKDEDILVPPTGLIFGYIATILLLMAGALVAIWFVR
jgi:hypothetical protein